MKNLSLLKKGFTLTEVMIVVGIIGTLATLALPVLLRAKVNANDSLAKARLAAVATAAEEYAGNYNRYPLGAVNLTEGNPPYISQDALTGVVNGFNVDCTWASTGYNCTATPVSMGITGTKIFTVGTGKIFTESVLPSPPETCSPLCGTYPNCVTCSCSPLCGTPPNCVACSCSPLCGTPPNCVACSCSPLCGTYPNCVSCGGGGGGGCFLSGTPILLSNGKSVPIESLKAGDQVMAFDEKTGQLKPDMIKQTFKHTVQEYIIVNGYLKATPNHPVYTSGKWIEIGALRIGDKLLNAQGKIETVTSLRLVKKQVLVYNLEVNPYQTYIASGLVVHNKKVLTGN